MKLGRGGLRLQSRNQIPSTAPVRAPDDCGHSIRDGQCRNLICLQGNLLGKHDVAWDQITLGSEAQEWSETPFEIDFPHVGNRPVLDSVPPPRRAADDVKVALLFKLCPLSWR